LAKQKKAKLKDSITFEGDTKAIIPKLRRLLKQKEMVTVADKNLKEMKTDYAEAENEVFIMMEPEGIQAINIEKKTMYRNVQVWMNVLKDKKEKAYEWLKTNGYEDLFYETINNRTLSSVLKEFVVEGGEIPADLINVKTTNKIGIRKS